MASLAVGELPRDNAMDEEKGESPGRSSGSMLPSMSRGFPCPSPECVLMISSVLVSFFLDSKGCNPSNNRTLTVALTGVLSIGLIPLLFLSFRNRNSSVLASLVLICFSAHITTISLWICHELRLFVVYSFFFMLNIDPGLRHITESLSEKHFGDSWKSNLLDILTTPIQMGAFFVPILLARPFKDMFDWSSIFSSWWVFSTGIVSGTMSIRHVLGQRNEKQIQFFELWKIAFTFYIFFTVNIFMSKNTRKPTYYVKINY